MVVSQNDEIPIGWPFGLGILNMRLRVVESLPANNVSAEPYSLSLHIPSTSFSSVSSSNLDTESTASFFKDSSVSLGHLIGIRPGERKRLYFTNPLRLEEKEQKPCSNDTSKSQEVDMSCGICIPSLLDPLLIKISKSKKNLRN
ncbi:unnamed protein product [Lathyrus oleraceus]|uniref:Uncharacterized protein n=1 Tax=Pisum sativum TaxID=3888 RepID=A0A9D4ZWR0_PEA|nr:uncharacterized protein LOC127101315 isoform X2 [Pisum sativum]KAI5386694.1 hypothetical protein KIW84_073008 [Pisum sativum]